MVSFFIQVFKLPILMIWFMGGLLWLLIIRPNRYGKLHRLSLKIFAKGVLEIVGVKVLVKGSITEYQRPTILISNHISWLDIFLIHSNFAGFFIAKDEIKNWPLVGVLVKRSGTIFIDRESRNSLKIAMVEMKEILKKNSTLVIFPEGTTTEGREILPFHSALFSIFTRNYNSQIIPVVIQYRQNKMQSTTPAFVGNITFFSSVLRILNARELEANITFLDSVRSDEDLGLSDSRARKLISARVRNSMEKYLQSING